MTRGVHVSKMRRPELNARAIDLRSKCPHFRILVIGRANAGKTTILKKVCNSIEDPEIFSPSGGKVGHTRLNRGLHDIENQLIFKSNRQFIFHDSRGFESGSLSEMESVKSFINKRAKRTELREQLHAIWYCLPTDTDRPLLEADVEFFNKYGSGSVPVVAIFTKCDGLITRAFNELRLKGSSIGQANKNSADVAAAMLQTNFIAPLLATKFRPSDHLQAANMQGNSGNCSELIEKTANVLSDDTLKLLFVSVQQNNLDLCTRNAVQRLVVMSLSQETHSRNSQCYKLERARRNWD
ncbi:GTP-binding protein [Mycena leptocephala]|nr:GTP-binding protein [Mycena leptocephala]